MLSFLTLPPPFPFLAGSEGARARRLTTTAGSRRERLDGTATQTITGTPRGVPVMLAGVSPAPGPPPGRARTAAPYPNCANGWSVGSGRHLTQIWWSSATAAVT